MINTRIFQRLKVIVGLLILMTMVLSGCVMKRLYQGDAESILNAIQPLSLNTSSIEPESIVIKDAETLMLDLSDLDKTVPIYQHIPNSYPYMLGKAMKYKNGYKWPVVADASGIYFSQGYLYVWKEEGYIYIDSPNDTVEKYVLKCLGLSE